MAAKKRPKRPAKKAGLIKHIRKATTDGTYLDITKHASDRSDERDILRTEYEHVLKHGWHEKRKDTYDERHKA